MAGNEPEPIVARVSSSRVPSVASAGARRQRQRRLAVLQLLQPHPAVATATCPARRSCRRPPNAAAGARRGWLRSAGGHRRHVGAAASGPRTGRGPQQPVPGGARAELLRRPPADRRQERAPAQRRATQRLRAQGRRVGGVSRGAPPLVLPVPLRIAAGLRGVLRHLLPLHRVELGPRGEPARAARVGGGDVLRRAGQGPAALVAASLAARGAVRPCVRGRVRHALDTRHDRSVGALRTAALHAGTIRVRLRGGAAGVRGVVLTTVRQPPVPGHAHCAGPGGGPVECMGAADSPGGRLWAHRGVAAGAALGRPAGCRAFASRLPSSAQVDARTRGHLPRYHHGGWHLGRTGTAATAGTARATSAHARTRGCCPVPSPVSFSCWACVHHSADNCGPHSKHCCTDPRQGCDIPPAVRAPRL